MKQVLFRHEGCISPSLYSRNMPGKKVTLSLLSTTPACPSTKGNMSLSVVNVLPINDRIEGEQSLDSTKDVIAHKSHSRNVLGQITNHVSQRICSKKLCVGKATGAEGREQCKTDKDTNITEESDFSDETAAQHEETNVEKLDTTMAKIEMPLMNAVDIDAEDINNPFCCAEYAEEIYRYLRKREDFYKVPKNYIQLHKEINVRMRAILVDWLVSVHEKFKLTQETLFLAISILDRYLAVSHKETRSNLQLIGVTAMFLASKIEEIYAPDISDLVYITDESCSPYMIKLYEKKMTSSLDFNFGDPLCIHFLRRNSKALNATAEQHALAKFFMELMLLDYDCSVNFPPSQRAAASLCVAMKITDNSSWNSTLVHYSSYNEETLEPCMMKISRLVLRSLDKKCRLASVRRKYSGSRFCNVAVSHRLNSAFITEQPSE